uniref:Uncharacterized protein n=1 Tax=Anguilla anguilla TaxID=7936 RepID=A0A0E9P5Y5_ANGAN
MFSEIFCYIYKSAVLHFSSISSLICTHLFLLRMWELGGTLHLCCNVKQEGIGIAR